MEKKESAFKRFWDQKKNRSILILTAAFALIYIIPWRDPIVMGSVREAVLLLNEYVREHVLLCLVPAFFIAGAIMVFLNQQAVIKYLGPDAPKLTAYGVASISGTILAVCSCTVLPIFKGIYKKGAGIGPAVAFLYSGPAINILAVILTAKVLGLRLGTARAVGAVLFAVAVGGLMHLIFRKDDRERATNAAMFKGVPEKEERGLGKTAIYIGSMMGILVFMNWASSGGSSSVWDLIYRWRYLFAGVFAAVLIFSLIRWFKKYEINEWVRATRDFAVQILPLLFAGVFVAGFLLGRPGHQALIPERWVAQAVGGSPLRANFIASVSGAFMYFATLTEVPILQGLLGAGMGEGPALALLLAGPSMSLPSLLVIGSELGFKKTAVYCGLVIILSTLAGLVYGQLFA
ncbi:MAG: permease [Spirochaetia bacterium]